MRREFSIIDTYGYVLDTVTVDVPATTTLDEATAEARAQFKADQRNAYEPAEQYKADTVIASIAEVRWEMPRVA